MRPVKKEKAMKKFVVDVKLGLKGGCGNFGPLPSELNFSFRTPPGMGLKGGSPFPMNQPTDIITKTEPGGGQDMTVSSNEQMENENEADFSEMDTQVMDIKFELPGLHVTEPKQCEGVTQDNESTARIGNIDSTDAASATMLEFSLSLPDDSAQTNEAPPDGKDSANQSVGITVAASDATGQSTHATQPELSMPLLDFDLPLPVTSADTAKITPISAKTEPG